MCHYSSYRLVHGPNPHSPSEEVAKCATTVPIDLYMDRAVKDTCSCAHREDLNYCFCNIFYVYAEECRQWGVDISLASIGGYCCEFRFFGFLGFSIVDSC